MRKENKKRSQTPKSRLFTPKKRLREILSTPGPGHYNIERSNNKSSGNRSTSKQAKSGANTVNVSKCEVGLGSSVGGSAKKAGRSRNGSNGSSKTRTKFETPGPAHYFIPTWNDSTGRSILERHEQKLKDTYPGPGMYDISLYTPKGKSFKISGSSTIDYEQKSREDNPPPNSYFPKYTLVSEKVKVWKIRAPSNKSKKSGSQGDDTSQSRGKSHSPGPGHYSVYDANGNKLRKLKDRGKVEWERFKSKEDPRKPHIHPGPAHYKPFPDKKKKKNRTIGKSERKTHVENCVPGVGSYSLRKVTDDDSQSRIGFDKLFYIGRSRLSKSGERVGVQSTEVYVNAEPNFQSNNMAVGAQPNAVGFSYPGNSSVKPKSKKNKPIEGISFPRAAKNIISVDDSNPGPGYYYR